MCPNFEMEIKDGRRLIFLLSCPKIWNAHRLNSIQWEKLNRNHTIWLAPTKKNDCISYQIETDLHVWTRRRKHQMWSVEQKLHQRDITTKWPNHMYISLCDSQEKEIENEMKWNELVKSSQFLVWNLCYHCIRRPKVQWFYFLIFNIHLDCFSLRSSIIIKANDHSTLSESIFDYAAWKGTTILRTK